MKYYYKSTYFYKHRYTQNFARKYTLPMSG